MSFNLSIQFSTFEELEFFVHDMNKYKNWKSKQEKRKKNKRTKILKSISNSPLQVIKEVYTSKPITIKLNYIIKRTLIYLTGIVFGLFITVIKMMKMMKK